MGVAVGGGSLGLGVLRLEDGTQGDGHEGGGEPVGLDSNLVAIGREFEAEAGDAGVEDDEVDVQVGGISDPVGELDDAGVVCEVDGPDFDLGLILSAELSGFVQGSEEGGPRFLAFGGVANGEDQAGEA